MYNSVRIMVSNGMVISAMYDDQGPGRIVECSLCLRTQDAEAAQ